MLRSMAWRDLAVEVDILAAAKFRVETRAELQQGGDAPARHHAALRGLQDAGDDLQQRTLAGTVRAYQRQRLAFFHFEADIA